MSKAIFNFKQFSVRQTLSAMKVGTDGVLLGAWAQSENPQTILDIGSGTGLISLIAAQRFPSAEISALEIDKDAFEESNFNFQQSQFADRLNAIHSSLQDFKTDQKFDLILSNPPFFKATQPNLESRTKARQHTSLKFEELLSETSKMLNPNGNAALIIPFLEEQNFLEIAKNEELFPLKITRVKGLAHKDFKRSLILFSNQNGNLITDELTIEIDRHIYTPEYIELTRDFYLNM